MKIGKYDVVRLVGAGGMSEVYEVTDPATGSRHALKAFKHPGDKDGEIRKRFVAEGRLLARLSHPRIVKVTDIGEDGGRPFFVMDLVLNPDGEKQSLADIPDGFADEDTIGRWYDDLREALAYIHSKGIVHRDLKLQNAMIGPDSRAVLMDFGISKDNAAAPAADAVHTIVNIRDGRRPVMGSVGYMAPELELGVEASPQSDWYALGVVIYRLLTGTWCDSRTDVASTLETYDPAWSAILPKLLHANPEGRECPSFAETKEAEREKTLAGAEERFLKEKRRGHAARHAARYIAAAALAAACSTAWIGFKCASLENSLEQAMNKLDLPTFDQIFKIPGPSAGADAPTVLASGTELALAQVDAWTLTHTLFEDLRDGRISLDELVETVKAVQRKVAKGDEDELWGDEYVAVGEDEPRQELFKLAVKRLTQRLKEEHRKNTGGAPSAHNRPEEEDK